MDIPKGWLTSEQAAEYTGYSVLTVVRAAASRELEGHRISDGGPWRFQPSSLHAWLTKANRKPRRSNRTPARMAADQIRGAA